MNLPKTIRKILGPAVSFCLFLPSVAGSAPLPVRQLFDPPAISLPKISANGKSLALRAAMDGRQYLALMDLMTGKLQLVAEFETTKLFNLMWKSDDLLLLVVQNTDGSLDFRSYDLVAKKLRFLSDRTHAYSANLLCSLPREPEDVIEQIRTDHGVSLIRMNTRTGKFSTEEGPSIDIVNWIVNREGEPVAAVCLKEKNYYLRWREATNQPWQRRELGPEVDPQLFPFAIHTDGKRLLAWDLTGPTTKALVALDPATMEKTRLFQDKVVDPDEIRYWGDDRTAPTAVIFENDRPRYHFIDQEAARIQTAVDAALPETFNEISSVSNDRNLVVIFAWSDRNPGVYYLLDRRSSRLAFLWAAHPDCAVDGMGQSRYFSFKARDGLNITGRLLLPPGHPSKPPLVLIIGGALSGPRSRFAFDPQQQIFATRGYAVARIDFRGCAGFGRAFLEAGNYKFATGMVDDVMDGLNFLNSQGLVDGDRIALLTKDLGAVVGTNALTRSGRFKVWLNVDSWLAPHLLSYSWFGANSLEIGDLCLSPKEKERIIADLGGEKAARQFLKSLEPSMQLPKIEIPSFHEYSRVRDRVANSDASIIYDYLKKHPGLGRSVDVEYDYDPKITIHNKVEAQEQMLNFLARVFPVTAP